MIQATLAAADYRAETEAGMQDRRGVRCTLSIVGAPGSVTVQLDAMGCVSLTHRADPKAEPKSILVGFIADLAASRTCVDVDMGGKMTLDRLT